MFKTAKLLKPENIKINFSKEFDVNKYWNDKIRDSIDKIWQQVFRIVLFIRKW